MGIDIVKILCIALRFITTQDERLTCLFVFDCTIGELDLLQK